jgi:hypothetical protein
MEQGILNEFSRPITKQTAKLQTFAAAKAVEEGESFCGWWFN